MVGRHACRLGGCHTNDYLACSRSQCESGGEVDGITECREVVDGGAKSGRANECLAAERLVVELVKATDDHGRTAPRR